MARVERRVVGLDDRASGHVELGERVRELHEVAVVVDGRVAAHVALTHERRPVDRGEHHGVVADVHVVGGIARLHLEVARCLGHLLEDEVGVQPDVVAFRPHALLGEQLDRLGQQELHSELAHDPLPAALEGLDRVGREDLVTRQLVDEHAAPGLMGD